MRQILTTADIEAIVGTAPPIIRMKQVAFLDDDCVRILAGSPIAGFGYRDAHGVPRSTLVGGGAGFANVHTPTRISFEVDEVHGDQGGPVVGGGVSMVFLLPGVGETLRLNGEVRRRTRARVSVDVQEAYVHCARCVLRSGLWAPPEPEALGLGDPPGGPTMSPSTVSNICEPLAQPAVRDLLSHSPFLVVSSWDALGGSDTSPRGDPKGFVRILDGRTLAIPDRKGNQRADTFHNVVQDQRISLAALVPGRDAVLHLSGRAFVTDDAALLDTMAVRGRPPKAALVVKVEKASIESNRAIQQSGVWERLSHVDRSTIPDLTAVGARHIATSTSPGHSARIARALSRVLGTLSPPLLNKVMNLGYRQQLRGEGYRADQIKGTLSPPPGAERIQVLPDASPHGDPGRARAVRGYCRRLRRPRHRPGRL